MAMTLKYFPQIVPTLEHKPINIIPPGVLNLALDDRGSLPTALSAGQLLFLRELQHTAASYIEVEEAGTGDATSAYFACNLNNVYSAYGAIAYLSIPFSKGLTPATDTFHKVTRKDGLYYHDTQAVGTPKTNVLTTGQSLLIDDDYVTDIFGVDPTSGYVEFGVQVGETDGITAYPKTVEYLAVVTDCSTLVGAYKSNDNQNWTEITKYSAMSLTWAAGVYTPANFKGSGNPAKVVKFATPETAVYFKLVFNTNNVTILCSEIMALNTCGECNITDDDVYFRGINPISSQYSPYTFVFESDQRAKAVEFIYTPITLVGSTGAIALDHVEIYTTAESVGFGTSGKDTAITIPYNTVSQINTAVTRYVTNTDTLNRTMKNVQVQVLIEPVDVVNYSPTAGLNTVTLPDAVHRVTQCRMVLNTQKNAIGVLGDTSIVVNATGAAFVTEVAGAPAGVGQYLVNYTTGVITTFTATNGSENISFAYNNEGSTSTEVSADGSTFYGPGMAVTLPGTAQVGQSLAYQIRRNLTNYGINRVRRGKIVAIPQFESTELSIV